MSEHSPEVLKSDQSQSVTKSQIKLEAYPKDSSTKTVDLDDSEASTSFTDTTSVPFSTSTPLKIKTPPRVVSLRPIKLYVEQSPVSLYVDSSAATKYQHLPLSKNYETLSIPSAILPRQISDTHILKNTSSDKSSISQSGHESHNDQLTFDTNTTGPITTVKECKTKKDAPTFRMLAPPKKIRAKYHHRFQLERNRYQT